MGMGLACFCTGGLVVGTLFFAFFLCFIVYSTRSSGIGLGCSHTWILRMVALG